ncbi:hypothetical protein C2G38_2005086 [Gigaspora rosea]|uniref:SH3 domain-containing protein n=1 Tax=Gigaspora rosea TaxID=44941 RepID=A0A397UN76_9GLOM|nr:hypothetical protein C2G38_2005086 [Gigaspora rosea]
MVLQFDLVFKSHFIVTFVIAGMGWIILLGGAGAFTSLIDSNSLSSRLSGFMAALWIYVIYQIAIIISLFMILASNNMIHYRFAILSLLIISFISNCYFAYNDGPPGVPQLSALIAGAIILAIINLFWIIIIGSEEDSPLVKAINEAYNNINFNFSPTNKNNPVGTRFVPQPSPMYTSDLRSNQLSVVISPTETSSPILANKTMYLAQAPMQSHYSSAILPSTSTQVQQVPYNQNSTTIPQSIYSENEQNSNMNLVDDYKYKAKALYDYHGSPEDRTELSFVKGDYLDIASKEGKWWHARKADGTTGIAPSNYLELISE